MSGGESGGSASRVGSHRLLALSATVLVFLALPVLVARGAVNETTLVSRADGAAGSGADGSSGPGIAVSASGRYVAFESQAANLSTAVQPPAPGQQPIKEIYLRDTQTGATTLVSRTSDGQPADGDSAKPALSPAGRYVAFESVATNLSTEDDDSVSDVFLFDTATGLTALVSRGADGSAANGGSYDPAVSGNAAFVAFESDADNLSTEDNDAVRNVFLYDAAAGATALISRAEGVNGAAGDGDSFAPSLSKDGSRIAFASNADNIFRDDRDVFTNVYVYTPRFKQLTHVSRTSISGSLSDPANGNSTEPLIADNGGHVAFTSVATNLAPGAGPVANVYVRDLAARTTTLASRADGAAGVPGSGPSSSPSVSGDGRQLAFVSEADNLNPVDDDSLANVYVRNFTSSTTTLVSRSDGAAGAAAAGGGSFSPTISREGNFVAFASDADNLSAADDDAFTNVFMRELPFVPAPPDVPPDLGSNDHSAHTEAEHAGHPAEAHAGHGGAAGHEGHVTPSGAPGQSLIGPPIQDVDRLFVLAQVHGPGKLIVTASVRLPGGGRATKLFRFRAFQRTVVVHRVYRVRLKLSRTGLRTVKRALKHGKRLNVVVVARAQGAVGGPWSKLTRRIRLRD